MGESPKVPSSDTMSQEVPREEILNSPWTVGLIETRQPLIIYRAYDSRLSLPSHGPTGIWGPSTGDGCVSFRAFQWPYTMESTQIWPLGSPLGSAWGPHNGGGGVGSQLGLGADGLALGGGLALALRSYDDTESKEQRTCPPSQGRAVPLAIVSIKKTLHVREQH